MKGWRSANYRQRVDALADVSNAAVHERRKRIEGIAQGPSSLEKKFEIVWRHELHGPFLNREHQFNPFRKWRFDFAHLPTQVAVEIEGGISGKSRHTSCDGYAADCEKYNEAAFLRWFVFRLPPRDVTNLKAIGRILHFVREREEMLGLIPSAPWP